MTMKHALITLLLSLLTAGFSLAQSPPAVRGVVVLVHGVSSGPPTYERFKARIGAELPGTALIELNWGKDGCFHASGSIGERANFAVGMDNKAWDGVAKLKDVVAQCRAFLGPDVPITMLCHSQGAVIAVAALQEGLRVDNLVMMGSCLGYESVRTGARNTRLGAAARNVSGVVVNLWSRSDQTAQVYKRGIGGFGLPGKIKDAPANLRDIRVDDVQHSGDDGWWAMGWLRPEYPGAWHGGARTDILSLLRGGEKAVPRPAALATVQAFAREDTSAGWYGDDDANATRYTFTLPQGLQNGIHFGDKDWCRATITCAQGAVRCRIRAARWTAFNEGTPWCTLTAGETAVIEYALKRSPKNATVWLQVEGLSEEIARAECSFEAKDR